MGLMIKFMAPDALAETMRGIRGVCKKIDGFDEETSDSKEKIYDELCRSKSTRNVMTQVIN